MRRGSHAHDPISRIKSAKQIYTWINRAKIIVQAGLWGRQSTIHLIGPQESQQEAEASRHRLQTPLLCPSHELQTAWQIFQELLFHLWWELSSNRILASRNQQNCPLTTLASPSWQTTQWQVFQTGYFLHNIIIFYILIPQSLFSINFKYNFFNSSLFLFIFGEISEIMGGSPQGIPGESPGSLNLVASHMTEPGWLLQARVLLLSSCISAAIAV